MLSITDIQRCDGSAEGARGREDLALVARARRGDPRAFEALVAHYQTPLLNMTARMVGDTDAAHDIVQEAFLKVFRRIDGFRGDASFATWLFRIAVNEANSHLRSERRRRQRQERYSAQQVQPAGGDDSELIALMQELPEKQRAALALFYVQELSLTEIAQAMDAAVGTVKSWLSRGRRRLRNLARERGLLL
jgi:RNA polymerase sigma-70 factor (ECF subfamily)